MKELILIGAGDFGRETAWLTERINAEAPEWKLLGFVDDGTDRFGETVDGYPFLGNTDHLLDIREHTYVVCTINDGAAKERIMKKVLKNNALEAANIIDPTAIIGRGSTIGKGCIIFPWTLITVNVTLGDNVVLNTSVGVGHDCVIGNNVTLSPAASVSGKSVIGDRSYIGTGAKIIQGTRICADVTIGAGGVVIRDITESGLYVGVPVIKKK